MDTPQREAIARYRSRLTARGLARFEVLGRDADRDLIRALARRLAEGGSAASRLRETMDVALNGDLNRPGGLLRALRQSPLVGEDLDMTREKGPGRVADL